MLVFFILFTQGNKAVTLICNMSNLSLPVPQWHRVACPANMTNRLRSQANGTGPVATESLPLVLRRWLIHTLVEMVTNIIG